METYYNPEDLCEFLGLSARKRHSWQRNFSITMELYLKKEL